MMAIVATKSTTKKAKHLVCSSRYILNMVTPGKIIAPDDSEILMMVASCNFLSV